MRLKRAKLRRQKFKTPVNYKKYFKFTAIVFSVCIALSGLFFLFAIANSYLASRSTKTLVLPVTAMVDLPDFEKKMNEYHVEYESAVVATSGGSIIVQINAKTTAYFSPVKDINWQVRSLQQIVNQLTIENKKPQYIDMRYDKPIVKF